MRFENYYEPSTVAECSELLLQYGDQAKILAGGTDLVPRLKSRECSPKALINICKIPDLDVIKISAEGLELGALARLRRISLDKAMEKDYKVIMEAAGHVSSMQVRNIATIGGNACNASPSADAIQGLMVMDAVAVIASNQGKRDVPIAEFFTGPGETVLGKGELLVCFKVPAPKPRTGAYYEKFAIRGNTDISIVGVGAGITLSVDGTVESARISLAAVAPKPLRMPMVEKILEGKTPTQKLIEQAAQVAGDNVTPITDQRATAEYRIEMVRVWTRHAIGKALEQARQKS